MKLRIIRPYYLRFKHNVKCIKCNISLRYYIRPKRGFIRCRTKLIYVICPSCKKIYDFTNGNLHFIKGITNSHILSKSLLK